jgi:hypothetical protein
MVPKWVRGEKKRPISDNKTKTNVPICALGGSIATQNGLTAEVIEVQSLEELAILGKDKIKGKIVFYNRPMDNEQIESFHAYSAVDQRYDGAKEASKFGAVGTIRRSMNLRLDDFLIQVPRVTVIFQNLNTFQRLLQMGLNYCLKKLKSNLN